MYSVANFFFTSSAIEKEIMDLISTRKAKGKPPVKIVSCCTPNRSQNGFVEGEGEGDEGDEVEATAATSAASVLLIKDSVAINFC